jgi:hypothetical protein
VRRVLAIAAVAAVVTALAAAAPALGLTRWSKAKVTYRDKSDDRSAVATAVRWWNDAPGPLRLVKAKKGARARVTIRSVSRGCVGWDGLTETSVRSGGLLASAKVSLNDLYLRDEVSEYVDEVAAHEIGHALGLPHLRNKCSLMYPSGSVATRCPDGAGPGSYFCGPQRADVRSIIARYGGSLGDWPGTTCAGSPPSARAASARAR